MSTVPKAKAVAESALVFPISDVPVAGQIIEVADGVHWLRMPLPFALDHINLWLLRDGSGWTIVDCGFGTDTTKKLWEELFAAYLDGRPVNRIVVTHLHPDHISLAAWLAERFGAQVWMTQTEFLNAHLLWEKFDIVVQGQLTDLFQRHGLDRASLDTMSARGNTYRRGIPALPATFRRIARDEAIAIDGREWRVIIGEGHSPEHASLHCRELGVLIAGDMVLPKITTNVSVSSLEPEGNPLQLFIESLQRYLALPGDTLILPSHGKVFYGLHTRIEELLRHHEERFALVMAACEEPRAAADLLARLFQRELDAHQLFFAMGEAIAHLNYLMHANRLRRVTGADGVYRFVRASA
jgi:glyoxylase-like metal-dependent hydrolase (beta-lactamase superfamily II)